MSENMSVDDDIPHSIVPVARLLPDTYRVHSYIK